MIHRPILTPLERGRIPFKRGSAYSAENVIDRLKRASACHETEKTKVIAQLPKCIPDAVYLPVAIEKSKLYGRSIMLVTRQEKRKYGFFRHLEELAIHIDIHSISNFADELEFIDREIVAGDAFVRECTSYPTMGTLEVRCECGTYSLTYYDLEQVRGISIKFGLIGFRELIKVLRGLETDPGTWAQRNLS